MSEQVEIEGGVVDAVNQESVNALYGDNSKPESEEVKPAMEDSSDSEEEVAESESKSPEEGELKEEKDTPDNEEIEYKLELKEDSLLDNSKVEEITSFAKEHNLSNEAAQAILNKQDEAISNYLESQQMAFEKQLDDWRQEVINDKTMGGENLKKTVENARRVVERFGDENIINMLRDTGYGDNPEVVRFLSRIGSIMSEDSLIMPSAKAESNKSIEELFYGNN